MEAIHPPEDSDAGRSLTFNRALDEYIEKLPKDKKQLKFIDLCRGSGAVSPQAINDLIQQEETKRTLSGPVKRLFKRVTRALEDYSDVIGQLVSAQPLPLAIIWGALKVVIESSARCRNMFDAMTDELRALADQLQRITDYEDLYGDSESMQRFLFRSYTNMIGFWHRVHQECTRVSTIRRAINPSASRELTAIVNDLKYDVDCIAQEASVCQAKLDSSEYAEAQKERKAAAEERALQSQWRDKQTAHNYLDLCDKIRSHLTPIQAHDANSKLHESNLQRHQGDTCNWLLEEPHYVNWMGSSESLLHILCLSGPVGYGKSMLSSFAIQDFEKRGIAVAYYFCQFSQPCDSAQELLRLLALQLFNVYFARKLPIDDDLCHHVLSSNSAEQMQNLICQLIVNLTPVYFFMDGLDEAQGNSHQHVSSVLHFLAHLSDDFDGSVRLWCTKRRQVRPVDCYENIIRPRPHLALEITDHTQADVVRYLTAKFDALETRFNADGDGDMCVKDRMMFLVARNYLMLRAEGNFLWARLMTQEFEGENRVSDVVELSQLVLGNPPKKMDDLFKTTFNRIKPDDRKIASKVIAIVAFARRHLRIEEIREVVLLLTTRGKKNANDGGLSKMALNTFLSKFTALIEFDKDLPESDSAGTCRLFHSSVLEFLVNNPTVLGEERSLHIAPYTIADACLQYLTRPVYSQLLQKRPQESDTHLWVDASGHSMDEHHFAQYAAKYWARHLEDVDPQEALRKRVAGFVTSPNFQTCMQIQTLWVEGKFYVYSVRGQPSLLRVLPDWFIRAPVASGKRTQVSKHWSDYRLLLHDWRQFLCCGTCRDCEAECEFVAFRGEVDRLWWASLGPAHFFAGFQSRYTSFRLAEEADAAPCKGDRFEALSITDGRIRIVHLRTWDHNAHTLEFVCEDWSSTDPSATPNLEKKQVIRTDEAAANWCTYARRSTPDALKLIARPTMFSEDGNFLRIGAQVFFLDADGEYRPFPTADTKNDAFTSYFEEFAGRGALVALGSRAHSAAQHLQDEYRSVEGFGMDFSRLEKLAGCQNVGDEECDDMSDVSSESDADDEAYESWSEGSTEDGEDLDSAFDEDEPDLVHSLSSDDESDSEPESGEKDSEDDASSEASEENDAADDDEDAKSDSSDDPPPLPPSAFMGFDPDSDDEEDVWAHEVDAHLDRSGSGAKRSGSDALDEPKMLFTVFDTRGGGPPKKLFQYMHPLSFMLYASPPSFHPHKPLVVWPLGAGDVLFADFVANTYFVRKLRPSAPHTRHISVKVHFSACGRYIHIASLEAQTDDCDDTKPKTHKASSQVHELPELRLYLLLSTYRLSSRKTTRSPPSLVHRVKVDLGGHATLTVSRLPFTFTWTTTDVFVTHNANRLTVYRVALFRDANTCAPAAPEQNVLVPKNRTFLPDTADSRDVHFVPSNDGTHACVILATEMTEAMVGDASGTRGMLSPPVGCFLRKEDLGGWIRSEDVPMPKGQGVGKLDRRREKFDPIEDCDG
ncbi:hypothetical protein BV25DRAFT_1943480 [Artomyces pyxidatus]|uniref:Uncharacterized protein n=1 Tax=Artomyces pyxidatus TaxID=48021 RepID=A0ACB8T3Q0_9AGAM|nr:hypothetical protein BV25DRAFT_1943480 [Artomyces pyxidatus]